MNSSFTSFCHRSKQRWTGFIRTFNIILCIVNLPKKKKRGGSALPKFTSIPFFYKASLKEWQSKEYNLGNPVLNTCLSFNIITLVSTQMQFQSPSLLVVDFMLVALIFPMAIKSHIGTRYYVASQVLKSVKYKLSIPQALLSECHYSHHRCWLSRSLFDSHLIPIWTKLNSKARTCLIPSL